MIEIKLPIEPDDVEVTEEFRNACSLPPITAKDYYNWGYQEGMKAQACHDRLSREECDDKRWDKLLRYLEDMRVAASPEEISAQEAKVRIIDVIINAVEGIERDYD